MQGRREASGVYLLCDLAQNYENLGGGRAKVEFGNLVTVENANQPSDLTRTLAGFSMMPATFLRPLLFFKDCAGTRWHLTLNVSIENALDQGTRNDSKVIVCLWNVETDSIVHAEYSSGKPTFYYQKGTWVTDLHNYEQVFDATFKTKILFRINSVGKFRVQCTITRRGGTPTTVYSPVIEVRSRLKGRVTGDNVVVLYQAELDRRMNEAAGAQCRQGVCGHKVRADALQAELDKLKSQIGHARELKA